MKLLLFTLFAIFIINICYSAPADNKDTNKDSKSAFGPAFDEIVVESSLTVRRKNPNARQARNQNISSESPTQIIKTKREINLNNPLIKPLGSVANAQAQAFDSFSPSGSFGASVSGALSQNFGFSQHSGAFSGTQQYRFNGQTVDIAFGDGGVAIAGRGRKERPLKT